MDRLISLQAAIDAPVKMVSEGIEWIPVYHLKDLPSAQQDNRLSKIADLVEGTIDHFDLDDAMDLLYQIKDVLDGSNELPSAQPEEVIPHRNYKYLSGYWCTYGWHLGKKGEVKYCADCGRKVNWDE